MYVLRKGGLGNIEKMLTLCGTLCLVSLFIAEVKTLCKKNERLTCMTVDMDVSVACVCLFVPYSKQLMKHDC